MPSRYSHRSVAIGDLLLPHQAADLIGMPEAEIWRLVKARAFPPPGLIHTTRGVGRLPVWERREIVQWLVKRPTRLQRPVK
jgi:predicted DNA-binding transcriptional regulator AlpA